MIGREQDDLDQAAWHQRQQEEEQMLRDDPAYEEWLDFIETPRNDPEYEAWLTQVATNGSDNTTNH